MKIGIYDPYLDTMSGGERYMLSIGRCLAKEHSVSLFWDLDSEEEMRHEAERKFGMKLDTITFTPNIFTPTTSFLKRFIQSKEYDLIIILSDGSLPLLGCTTIVHFQSPVEWVASSFITNLKLLHIKRVICNSQYTKSYIDKKFHLQSDVLYPPVDLPEKMSLTKEKRILNLGRMGIRASGSSYKKQETLRDAFISMVKNGLKDWELVFIVNSTENEKDIVDAFQESIQGYPIKLLINPDMGIVKKNYASASLYWHAAGFGEDLVVHPDRAEHFGLSTVEAMHYGAVPIVIDAGGQPEIVTDGETGYLWNTEAELIQKTKDLMVDEKTWKTLSVAAQKRAEKFSVQQFCQELTKLI